MKTTDLNFNFNEAPSRAHLAEYLSLTAADDIAALQQRAENTLLQHIGNKVFFRGLVEASNICARDCYYCGICKSNRSVERYQLPAQTIVDCAKQAKAMGYASFVIQAGERRNPAFIAYIEKALRAIKSQTRCDKLPQGLGITLSLGEQTKETYQRFFEAGAHRYLLRIETANPKLFASIHPSQQTLEKRLACLQSLREVGFQVGTGIMIGLPGQNLIDLATDILFFKTFDVDMIGMGPYIPHAATYRIGGTSEKPPCAPAKDRVRLTLLMTALTRLILKDVNIAATTALQTLDPEARFKALRFGANVIMPQLTPIEVRSNYSLYPKKPMSNEAATAFNRQLAEGIRQQSREIGLNEWGDSPHAQRKKFHVAHHPD